MPGLRFRCTALGVGVLLTACRTPPAAAAGTATSIATLYHTWRVGVVVDRVDNLHSGLVFQCFDPQPFGCGRGDFYAVMSFVDGNGNTTTCDKTGLTEDRDFIRPGWTCTTNGTPFAGSLAAPVTFMIAIWDFDGGLRAIDGDDGADLGAGPGKQISIPMTVGTSTVTRTGPDMLLTVTLTVTEVPATFSLNLAPPIFDPGLGETTTIMIGAAEPMMLDMEVRQGTTIVRRIAGSLTPPGSSDVWDGRRDDGSLAPPGPYQILVTPKVAGRPTNPASRSAPATIVNRAPRTFLVLGVSPPRGWNPRAGPLSVRFSLSTATSIGLRVFAGTTCGGGAPVRSVAAAAFPAGVSSLAWNGQDDQSVFVPPGPYVLEMSAAPAGGLSFNPATLCQPAEVLAAPPLELSAAHGPLVPRPSGLVDISATALDGLHADRRTGTIELWVASAAQISNASPPQAPEAQCQAVAVCATTVLNAAGSPTATRFAYRAVAYDIGGTKVETPWRLVDMVPATRFSAGASATPVMAGVVSEPLGTVRQDQAIDLTFYPGSGFDVTQDDGRRAFLATAATHVRAIMGAGTARHPSSVLSRQTRFNIWVSPRPVSVTSSQPSSPAGPNNLCSIGSIQTAPFAEANGVIHRVVCRDNAPGNKYTANADDISWHELHHAAFDLADEYYLAGPPEISGGYFQTSPFPNLYYWPGDCTADPLSSGACTPLRAAGTFAQATRWWRIDQGTRDVMWDNTIEQATDLRRAMWKFDQCDAGKC